MVFRLTCIIIISSDISLTLLHTSLLKTVHSLWKILYCRNNISAKYRQRVCPINMLVCVFRSRYKTVHDTERFQITAQQYHDDMWLDICAGSTALKYYPDAEECQSVPQTVSSACSITVKYRMPV
jgi:hypothetical protein